MDDIRAYLKDAVEEFKSKNGIVCIEISIRRDMVASVFEFIQAELPPVSGAWVAFECETCCINHGPDYVHLILEDNPASIEAFKDKNIKMLDMRSVLK